MSAGARTPQFSAPGGGGGGGLTPNLNVNTMSPADGYRKSPYDAPSGNPVMPSAAGSGGLGDLDFDLGGPYASNLPTKTPPDSLAPANMQALPIEEQIRRVLVGCYICYAPERLTEIPAKIVELRDGGATAEHVLEQMKKDWGQVPVEGEILAVLRQSFLTRLYCFFARNNPAMFRNVPHMAKKYRAAQAELFTELEVKYAPDQDPMRLFCEEDQKAKEAAQKLFEELQDSDEEDEYEDDDQHDEPPPPPPAPEASGTFGDAVDPAAPPPPPPELSDDDEDDDTDFNASFRRSGATALAGAGAGSPGSPDASAVMGVMDRLGIDRSSALAPLPRFSDPLGTMKGKQMTAQDMDLL